MTYKEPFEIVTTSAGATSIKDTAGGEIIHNPVGPWKESRALYVKQSRLEKRLCLKTSLPLVLFDVGLGAGFNALAAVEKTRDLFVQNLNPRQLHIVSFESDLRLFDFAVSNLDSFPESQLFESDLREFREKGHFENDYFKWDLKGKLTSEIDSLLPKAEVVFFDPYSPKINPDTWTIPVFEGLRKLMTADLPGCLITYSTATRIRTAMLLAGFYVGQGEMSGLKLETTYAATQMEELQLPLGERWIQRWIRSHQTIPLGDHGLTTAAILERLEAHPQFSHLQN